MLFSSLTRKGYATSIVLDNVDQHTYLKKEYQEHALLVARNLTETLSTVTIITLREESYFRSIQSGVLTAFVPPFFHISSPPFEKVIRSRIDYILKTLENEEETSRIARRDIKNREEGLGPYQIPFHHVLKSIILEHSRLYSEERSRIVNLFSVNPKYTNSHFIHLRILNYLYGRLSYETCHGRGFVEIDDIIRKARELMINVEAISDSIKKMARFGLVQFENQSKEGYDEATYVRIANTGIYYLKELVYKFPYLDLAWMDTPISDEATVEDLLKHVVELRPRKTEYDIEERFDRTESFLKYLWKMEDAEFGDNPELRDSNLTDKEFIPSITKSYEEQKKYIKERRADTYVWPIDNDNLESY